MHPIQKRQGNYLSPGFDGIASRLVALSVGEYPYRPGPARNAD